ncbi:MAG: porin [Alphaproteobacteria bacterium]|nr:porin [Alphaproteobacteria bacterium]
MKQLIKSTVSAIALAATVGTGVAAQDSMPSKEEMWKMLLAQQEQIKSLKAQVEALSMEGVPVAQADREKLNELSVQVASNTEAVEATTAAVETAMSGETGAAGWAANTSIGGYGELHYNGGDADEIDFHRFVLFANHRFNDWISFASELELEHSLAGDGKPGEVELEQAFIDLNLTEGLGLKFGEHDSHTFRAGLFLLPVGILNDTHEPNTFYGVERNNVEKNIIPTTWWEGGFGMRGQLTQGLSYDLYYTSGLSVPTDGSKAFNIRSGRKKVAEAPAENGAITARLKWTAIPGVELAATFQHQSDLTQGAMDADANLIEAHANIQKSGFGLRALYARWNIDNAQAEAIGRDKQIGWYVEPSYRFALSSDLGEFGLFARHEEWDTEAGLNLDSNNKTTTFGFNYWPHENVVFKFDYQSQQLGFGADGDDRINLGVGYQF